MLHQHQAQAMPLGRPARPPPPPPPEVLDALSAAVKRREGHPFNQVHQTLPCAVPVRAML